MADDKKIMQAFTELKDTVEKKDQTLSETKEKLEKINAELDKQEEKNQEVTRQLKEKEKAELELKEKLEGLEKIVTRPGNSIDSDLVEAKKEMEIFEKAMITGVKSETGQMLLTQEELKYLRTDNDVQGGYLAPLEYMNEITKKITEITPVRTLCRLRQTTRKGIEIPKRETLQSASRPGEGNSVTNNNSEYGSDTIYTHRLTASSHITVEMLNDSAFNMDSEITMDFVEQFAVRDGSDFVNGTGVNMPEGFLVASGTTELNSGIANSYDADALIEITGELKTGYNPVFGLNRKEIAFVRTLKDGNGQYLWNPGIAAGIPNTIVGFPYVEMPDMPNRGTNTNPVVFADFFRGYTWVDRQQMTVVRDIYTLAEAGKVRFVGYMFDGGGVVLPEAIAKIKCAV